MEAYLALLQNSVSQYGIWFVVAALFIENIPIVGLFAPGLTILVLSGFFYKLISDSYLKLFIIAWLAIIAADTFWYFLGYFGQRKNRWLNKIATYSPNVEELLRTQPFYILAFYQFIPYLRMILPFSLGMYRYTIFNWLILCIIASALYTAVFFGIGVVGALVLKEIASVDTITGSLNSVLAILAVLYVVYAAKKYLAIRNSKH